MKKRTLLSAFVATLLVIGSVFTVYSIHERNVSPMLNANIEALLQPEVFTHGKGESWKEYDFSTNAIFLHWDSCMFLYGVPKYPFIKYYCQ